jgi:pantothenate kinase
MDGFHFDDVILQARGQRSRKGAAFTFDSAGLEVLLQRIRQRDVDVAIPIFDRALELSRAGAAIVPAETRFVLVEGNYLLLREEPWCRLHGLFDFRVFLDVPISELQRRLLLRIQSFGYSAEHAERWLAGNDLPNIRQVLESSVVADLTVRNMG